MSGYDYSQEVANQLLEDSDKQIEQLQAKIAELEAEVERLSAAHVKACQANADSQAELAAAIRKLNDEVEPIMWECCVPGQDVIYLDKEPSDDRYPPKYKRPLYSVSALAACVAQAEQRVAEWQPIETAPKGARGYAWMYLAWGPDEDKNTGCGLHANGKFYAAASFFTMSGERAFEWREIEVSPTHWMPLPKAPANTVSS